MHLVRFDDARLGAVVGDEVIDITRVVPPSTREDERMRTLIADWSRLREPAEEALAAAQGGRPLKDVVLLAPLDAPTKIVAAPVNYRDHTAEMVELVGKQLIETYKGFLKAPSSIIGPNRVIQLPFADRRTDYEGELGLLIGRDARRVGRADALDYVFGYVPLLDMTIRGDEDRSFRKSADTFTPIGPGIVTADEIPDPAGLSLRLWLNGELRQDANTADLVWDVPMLIETYSRVMTLHAGDVIATGTPAGVGEVQAGDRIRLSIDRLPTLEMSVEARKS
jgi:2-keto-4-pentenoate hydratase/2-oxohepta-3-ene-1,7-dioic acid hydratase in catechol pathway